MEEIINDFELENWRTYDLGVTDGFMDASVYPDPSADEVRKQLQSQHSQLRDYVNDTIVVALKNRYTKEETRAEISDAVFDSGNVTPETVQAQIDTSITASESNMVKVYSASVPDVTNEFSVLNLTDTAITIKDSSNHSISFKIEVEV